MNHHLLFLFLCLCPICLPAAGAFIDEGYIRYSQGQQTQTPEEKRHAFNDALTIYLSELTQNPSGRLLYNIGNCYCQLKEYGLALWYYYRAYKEMPRAEPLIQNIQRTKELAHLPPSVNENMVADTLLFFHRMLSLYEREMCLLGFLLCTFAFASFAVWLPQPTFLTLAFVSLGITIVFSASIAWTLFFAPLEAVIIYPTPLYKGAGTEYPTLPGLPLIPGTKVTVRQVVNNGNWLKVESSTHEEGFVAKEQARVI